MGFGMSMDPITSEEKCHLITEAFDRATFLTSENPLKAVSVVGVTRGTLNPSQESPNDALLKEFIQTNLGDQALIGDEQRVDPGLVREGNWHGLVDATNMQNSSYDENPRRTVVVSLCSKGGALKPKRPTDRRDVWYVPAIFVTPSTTREETFVQLGYSLQRMPQDARQYVYGE